MKVVLHHYIKYYVKDFQSCGLLISLFIFFVSFFFEQAKTIKLQQFWAHLQDIVDVKNCSHVFEFNV